MPSAWGDQPSQRGQKAEIVADWQGLVLINSLQLPQPLAGLGNQHQQQ